MALLEINNLEYSYGQVKAVKGISMHVNEGEIVTLIGSNGAGKTTTLRTVSGLVSPQGVRGEILFDGQTIQKNPGYKIARLGLYQVLEGRHVFPKLTVEENLATGAYNVRDSKQVKDGIREVYRLFPRLEERKTSFGGNLSGGEQQMLAIGRALINRPKLMILDEPSLGLAPIIIREIFESIKRINADPDHSDKEEDLLTTLEVCYEFYLRGFTFDNIDLYASHATKFLIRDGRLLPPFVSVSGLGESAAWDIMEGREGKHFVSIEEFSAACPKVSKTHIENLKQAGAFGDLPDTSQITLF